MSTIEDIFKEYYDSKDDNAITISQLFTGLGDMVNNIVLYGAGSAGIAFLYYLRDVGINPVFFADGNSDKWGRMIEDLEVIDYHTILERVGNGSLVIVTINTDGVKYCKSFDDALRAGGHAGVHKVLWDCGCRNVVDYTYFRRCHELFRGDRYNLPSCSDVYEMEEHIEDIIAAYNLMDDDKSRDVFERIVRFRLIDDTISIPTEPQDMQYFEYEFFSPRDDEIFIDCGAYNGISLKTLLRVNGNKLGGYIGLEPDANNYSALEEYVTTLTKELRDKISLINKCAYDSDTSLKLYALAGPGSFVADIGQQTTEGIRIDDITGIGTDARGNLIREATFIKMNIEGSEVPALEGAKETIRICGPRLAIAGYHKTKDLWQIPLMIHEFDHDYKIHLRSYMNNVSFVYYAEKE